MSASSLSPARNKTGGSDKREHVPSAQEIREDMRLFTMMGISFDVLWHHYLRQFCIGPPRALHTVGVYTFWASVWYCASHAGDWTHTAIARDRDKIPIPPLPDYDGIWDHGAVSATALAKNLPLKRETYHYVACCAPVMVPLVVRVTYAYRPWFWQRRLPFKVIWCGMAVFTGMVSHGAAISVSESRSKA